MKNDEPTISVGIIDRKPRITGRLNGNFAFKKSNILPGSFEARAHSGNVILTTEDGREIVHPSLITLRASPGSTFLLHQVTIGIEFHWQRTEEQSFLGDLVLSARDDGTITAINEILLEDYLKSVISSEMNTTAPKEFLKTHAILSRSWLLATLERAKGKRATTNSLMDKTETSDEFIRWYDREDHDIFDVCADDHCQRYQGITKIISRESAEAVSETRGMVITYDGMTCDARYAKACGGITENFGTAWEDLQIPYLSSVSDSAKIHSPVRTEEEAKQWITEKPEAYCNTNDTVLLATILPGFDNETKDFFRWKVEYTREELEEILKEKSGLDFGSIKEIVPLKRGPSGRISRLRITGTKRSVIVGKELEIRRWLSRSHLYSSAFIVTTKGALQGIPERFIFQGAGWGHGVGLCQIGAAVMASKGFKKEEILKHYFRDIAIEKIYE